MRSLLTSTIFAILASAAPAYAQAQQGSQAPPSHAWIDVNLLRALSFQDAQTLTFSTLLHQETASAQASYPALPGATGFGLSGGAQFGKTNLGVGINFDAVNYQSTVALSVRIPSPYFFNTFASASTVTNSTLERRDRSVDISVEYFVPTANDKVRVRVFGGPTYFSIHNNMVSLINYNQTASPVFPLNSVTITTFDSQEVSGSAWGFNAGVDVSWFFDRYVGVGGLLRFNKGTVSVTDPFSFTGVDLKAGHVVFGGGVRFRF